MSVNFHNEKFEAYFSSVYKERWPALYKALLNKETQVLRKNKFANFAAEEKFTKFHSHPFFKNCFDVNPEIQVHGLEDEKGLQVFYKMDPASFVVASALDVQPGDLVLDLCAAPGGKTLILAEALAGSGQLLSNEYSNSRRERLIRVVREYISHDDRQNIFVQGKDGNYYGQHQTETFDRVLADVPCSGERHLLENAKEFAEWTKRRSENLAIRQYSLLSSAYLACKNGGHIVYSTCSISPLENDDVIKKLKKKRSIELIDLPWISELDFIEKTGFGYQILPDRSGFGPMFFSVVKKTS